MDNEQNADEQSLEQADQSAADETQDQGHEVEQSQDDGNQDEQTAETQSEELGDGENGEEEAPTPTRREKRQAKYIEKLTKQLEQNNNREYQSRITNQDTYKPLEYGEQEYQIDDLQRDRQQFADNRVQQAMSQTDKLVETKMWLRDAEVDNGYVDRKYPVLNENSSEFDPDIANYINRQYLTLAGYDGNTVKNPIRYRDFVNANMELAERLVTTRNAETAQNLARQAGQTSVKTGSNSRRQARDWSDPATVAALSPDEYEKAKPEIESWMRANLPTGNLRHR